MFRKGNSRFLIAAAVLLIGQIMVGAAYFVVISIQALIPAIGVAVGNEEWIRTLTVVAMGVLLMLGLKRWPKIFDPGLTRAEKVFKFITLGMFDGAICMAISYLLSLPMVDNELSLRAVQHSLGNAAILAVVNLGMFLIVPRLKLFRQSFSRGLNWVVLALILVFGWNLVWLARTLTEGPNGSSEMTKMVFDQQLFRSGVLGIVLAVILGILAMNGEIMGRKEKGAGRKAKGVERKVNPLERGNKLAERGVTQAKYRVKLLERKAEMVNRRAKRLAQREAQALRATAYRTKRDTMRLESEIRRARRRRFR